MKINEINPPREFDVGRGEVIKIKDCARIELSHNEQVTFLTESGAELDVARKDWGFYATPSLNGRLKQFGWRAALVKSPQGKYYLFLLESGKDAEFYRYLEVEDHSIVCWLDSDEALQNLEESMRGVKNEL
jgi:hypothetical protein